ncbi:MAG TPA: extracellular solute-binding protein [Myxococcales bacterium]|nr:extracellular solute-binding protein [Myxococcales bacterium]
MPRGLATLLLAAVACTKASGPPPAPEVQLATDLPAPVIDTALRLIAQAGGPVAQRVAGASLGAAALAGDGGQQQKGDVRWDAEPYGAIAAAQRGELLPMPITARDVPALWRDPGGTWVAVGGRAVVLLVASDLPKDRPTPAHYAALTEPWLKGKVAIAAPTEGASLAHFAALFQAWGESRMHAWMKQLEANAVQVLDSDDAVRQAVVSGKALVGVLSSDEAAKAAASAARVSVEYPNQGSIGTFVWPTALSRPKDAPHPAAAVQLAERLASREVEQLLVARVPGYLPLRASIAVPPGVTSAANLVVVSVDPARIVAEIARRKAELAAWTTSMRRPGG